MMALFVFLAASALFTLWLANRRKLPDEIVVPKEKTGRGFSLVERQALPAIALSTDTSILTSIANDYDYSQVFSRQVQGLGRAGDVFWGISTSGNSENVNKAIIEAKNKRMITIASTGKTGGEMVDTCDVALVIPSDSTARIQEMHILCAHIICQLIDDLDWGK